MSIQLLSCEGQSQEFHLFGSNQEIQAVRFMLGSTTVELKSTHLADGSTSLDVLLRQIEPPSPPPVITHSSQHAAAMNDSPTTQSSNNPAIITCQEEHVQQVEVQPRGEQPPSSLVRREEDVTTIQEEEYVKKMRGWIMVVATLFAAMTFQAGLNPPGGFWQDDLDSAPYPPVVVFGNKTAAAAANFPLSISPCLSSIISFNLSSPNITITAGTRKNVTRHQAGDPVISGKHPWRYIAFSTLNTGAFTYSLFLICGLLYQKTFHSVKSLIRLRNLTIYNAVLIWLSYAFGSLHQCYSIVIWTIMFILFMLLMKGMIRVDVTRSGRRR